MNKKYDVYGIGNALVDFLVEVDENVVNELGLNKGQLNLVDEKQSKKILDKIKYAQAKISAGGSASNATATIGMLGGKTAFCGKIGDDEYGFLYETETKNANVEPKLTKGKLMTGHCIVLITPDADRTFAVNLGASLELKKDDINEQELKKSRIMHIDGFQLENLREVSIHAMELARKHGVKVSLDLSDPGVVTRNKEVFLHAVQSADIVFANEYEAKALTGKGPEDAIKELTKQCEYAAVKLGEKGSLIADKNKIIKINAVKAEAVDTTGAGDAYAGGFLYGITHGMSVEEAGNLASLLGAKVVGQIGGRLRREDLEEIN